MGSLVAAIVIFWAIAKATEADGIQAAALLNQVAALREDVRSMRTSLEIALVDFWFEQW